MVQQGVNVLKVSGMLSATADPGHVRHAAVRIRGNFTVVSVGAQFQQVTFELNVRDGHQWLTGGGVDPLFGSKRQVWRPFRSH